MSKLITNEIENVAGSKTIPVSDIASLTDVDQKVNPNNFTEKSTPVDADSISLSDSADSFNMKKLSWGNLKASLTTYFEGIFSKFGIGQTWQDMTASRSAGVTYTNTTGKPIAVKGSNIIGSGVVMSATVDGVKILDEVLSGTATVSIGFVVPDGATYKIDANNSSSLAVWSELR